MALLPFVRHLPGLPVNINREAKRKAEISHLYRMQTEAGKRMRSGQITFTCTNFNLTILKVLNNYKLNIPRMKDNLKLVTGLLNGNGRGLSTIV